MQDIHISNQLINIPLLTTALHSCISTIWADRSAAAALSAVATALLLLAPSPSPLHS